MITRSDNQAATAIYSQLPRPWVWAEAHRLQLFHLTLPVLRWGSARTTAAEQARLFSTIDTKAPPRHQEFVREALASVVASQRWGAAEARPPGWRLLCKNGWGSPHGELAASLARFEHAPERVTLAVYVTRSPSLPYALKTISGLAHQVLRDV